MKKKNLKILNFQKKDEYSCKRKVLIKDLIFNTSIGIHDFEKKQKQQIKFNIEIVINSSLRPSNNNLNTIVNYEDVISSIKKYFTDSCMIGNSIELEGDIFKRGKWDSYTDFSEKTKGLLYYISTLELKNADAYNINHIKEIVQSHNKY